MINPEAFLTIVIHGEAKKGKTTLAATSPAPILFFDAEAGGMRFLKGRKVTWDPQRDPDIPDMDGAKICVVKVDSTNVLDIAISRLERGNHPFKSFVFDSVTEYQERIKRELSRGALKQDDWGVVYNRVTDLVMRLREVVEVQDQVECFVVITGTEFRDKKYRPLLQGGMKNRLSYKLDAIAFLDTQRDEEAKLRRVLRIEPDGEVDAGNRFPGDEWPEVIWDPDISAILEAIDDQVTYFKEQEDN